MKRRTGLGRATGALTAVALTTALITNCGGGTNDPDTGGSGTSGSSSGTTSQSGASGSSSGSTSTGGGGSTSTGGTTANTGGLPQAGTSGATTTSGAGGTTAGTGTVGGAGTGTGGTPIATGGTSAAGGSTSGSAGTGAAGAGGGGDGCGFNGPRPAPALGSWPPPNLSFPDFVTGVDQPTAISAPRCDSSRIYVTEKWGRIRLIKDGVLQPDPALDIRDEVLEGGPQSGNELMHQGKRGLVGLAFHPNYVENGRIFVMYVADQGTKGVYGTSQNMYDDGDQTFAEYRRSASNPDVFDPEPVGGMPFLQFDKGNCDQCQQHNGGSLEIDVDGFLMASTGDPPPYTDPGSQNLMNLNGKLLRFDISGDTVTGAGNYPGAESYVSSIGIRNAYKFSVDRYTGDIYVGDVGEADVEEVTVERYGQRNKNHGWPMVEGTVERMGPCTDAACLDPVFEYDHTGAEGQVADNCIIGGYVYRGSAIPALQGAYVYGDNGSGKIRAIQVENGVLKSAQPHTFNTTGNIFMGCFGEDAAGELYVCDYNNNKILRVAAQ